MAIEHTRGKRFLFISVQAWGHVVQMRALAKEMQRRGADVTFSLTHRVAHWIEETSLRFVAWEPPPPKPGQWKVIGELPRWRQEKAILRMQIDKYEATFVALSALIERERPDVVVCDRVLIAAVDAADRAGIPCVVFGAVLGDVVRPDLGSPQYCTPYASNMSLVERALNAMEPALARLRTLPELRDLERARRRVGIASPWTEVFYRHPVIAGISKVLEVPRRLPPSLHVVGFVEDRDPAPLSPELARWMDMAPDVVYVAQGTQVVRQRDALRRLLYGVSSRAPRVLWSLTATPRDDLGPLPSNVRVEASVPQHTILHHPSTRVFVSHCGANSAGECLLAGKPILAVPSSTDQYYNSARVLDAGFGLVLANGYTEGEVADKTAQLLDQPAYRIEAERCSRIARLENGRERAAVMLEEVAEVGYQHVLLRDPPRHLGGLFMV